MTDFPEEIHDTIPVALSNPTLGAAANGVFLDVMEAQIEENRRAEIEGRPARMAKREARRPNYEVGEINSSYSDITFGTHFEDGEPITAPQGGPEIPTSGNLSSALIALTEASRGTVPPSKGKPRQTPQVVTKTPEKTTQAPSRASRATVDTPGDPK